LWSGKANALAVEKVKLEIQRRIKDIDW
jgi:hypothetical protein